MCLPELLLRLLLVLALIRVWLAELLADAVCQLKPGVEGVDLLLVAVAGLIAIFLAACAATEKYSWISCRLTPTNTPGEKYAK